MFDIVSGALRVSLVTFVLCGFAYPFAVTVLGQLLTPFQAHGSLATNADGVVLGSRLIGQNWTDPKWFRGRPSATTDTDPNNSTKTIPAPYNAASSSASNLGPTSKALQDRLADDRKALDAAQPGLAGKTLPADVLTTSGSGLDPDITPANANLQIERIAKARGVAPDQIAALVSRHTTSRSLGIFGEPRVNVLELNLELEKTFPARETKEKPPAAEASSGACPRRARCRGASATGGRDAGCARCGSTCCASRRDARAPRSHRACGAGGRDARSSRCYGACAAERCSGYAQCRRLSLRDFTAAG